MAKIWELMNQQSTSAPAQNQAMVPNLNDLLNMNRQSFLTSGGQAGDKIYQQLKGKNPRATFNTFGSGTINQLTGFGREAMPLGLSTLNDILASGGRTSPELLNRQLAGIGLGTQANMTATQGNLARLGLQNSGVGQALSAAIGQAGVEQQSDAIARDNFLAEQRRRQDLDLLLQLIIGPAMQASGFETNLRGIVAAKEDGFGQNLGASLSGAGGFMSGIGGMTGGSGGAATAGGAAAACWVAREIYGASDPRWLLARHYILNMASPELRETYLKHGPEMAQHVKRSSALKARLTPIFDAFVQRVIRWAFH